LKVEFVALPKFIPEMLDFLRHSVGPNVTLSNMIHDVTTAGSLTKIGAGTLTLSSANTYSGGSTISGGTLSVQNNTALGSGALTFDSGTLQAGGLTLGNAIKVNGTGRIVDGGSFSVALTGNITSHEAAIP
jgi:autotransporter-associated beta strand protein